MPCDEGADSGEDEVVTRRDKQLRIDLFTSGHLAENGETRFGVLKRVESFRRVLAEPNTAAQFRCARNTFEPFCMLFLDVGRSEVRFNAGEFLTSECLLQRNVLAASIVLRHDENERVSLCIEQIASSLDLGAVRKDSTCDSDYGGNDTNHALDRICVHGDPCDA